MVQEINPSAVLRRWGIVTAIRVNGTVDVDVAGVEVSAVKRIASYNPVVGERVQIDVVGTDMVVVGATAPSPRNQTTNIRVATVTTIQTNGLLNVTFDDGQIATGLQRMATYNPTVNDVVQVLQSGSTTKFIVLGPLYGNTQPYLRRPTGDIEQTIRKTPKPGTLFLNGDSIKRADYPALFAWVQAQGLLQTPTVPNLFGMGDQSTTFVLPDLRGKVMVGADTAFPLGATSGAESESITIANANLPAHKHNTTVTLSQHEGHGHAIFNRTGGHAHGIGGAGEHTGHFNGGGLYAAGGFAGPIGSAFWVGNHVHGNTVEPVAHTLELSVEGQGKPHTVTVGETTVGATTPTPLAINKRQPSYSVNYLIYT
jgi:microcystin-dependent protein